jgi:ribokinase
MTVFNLGSINADHFYSVPRLPGPGETIAAGALGTGLGGKGANQSVAAARAGARVVHIGAVGADGAWAVGRLRGHGIDTRHVAVVDRPTAHAIINVDPAGENAIVIFPGANHAQDPARIAAALSEAGPGDILLLQNETTAVVEAARLGRARGCRVIYSAAPFDADAVRAVMAHVDLLVLNAVEAAQLAEALGVTADALPVPEVLVTRGAQGAAWRRGAETAEVPGLAVTPVDTTGAGDTFTGYVAAALDEGLEMAAAMRLAAAAAALKVTRRGTADAIPDRAEVAAFLAAR